MCCPPPLLYPLPYPKRTPNSSYLQHLLAHLLFWLWLWFFSFYIVFIFICVANAFHFLLHFECIFFCLVFVLRQVGRNHRQRFGFSSWRFSLSLAHFGISFYQYAFCALLTDREITYSFPICHLTLRSCCTSHFASPTSFPLLYHTTWRVFCQLLDFPVLCVSANVCLSVSLTLCLSVCLFVCAQAAKKLRFDLLLFLFL